MKNKYIALLNQDFCSDFHVVLTEFFNIDNNENINTIFIGFDDNGQGILKVNDNDQTLVNILVSDYMCRGLTYDSKSIDLTKTWIGYFANKLETYDRINNTHFYIDYISNFKTYREEYKHQLIDKLIQQVDTETSDIINYMQQFMKNF